MHIEPAAPSSDALAILTDEVLDGLGKQTQFARGLPNAAFTTDAFLGLENKFLFSRSWVFAGRVGEVPKPGDVKPVEISGCSLFMVRGTDGEIRVFQNVCPHRGARLVTESLQGTSALTCPYHAWSYELDGRLKGRPHYHGPDQHDRGDNLDAHRNDQVCLFSVRNTVWHDWVFVNLDGQGPSFEEYIDPIESHFEGWDLSQFRYAHHDTFEFQCNWKLAVENFCDTYHVFKIHAALDEAYVPSDRSTAHPAGVHMLISNTLAGPGRGLTLDREGPELPYVPNLDDELLAAQPAVNLFPNVTIAISPGNLEFVMFEPVGPNRCIMHLWFYFIGDACDADEHKTAREMVYAEWAHINAEDEGVCRRMQEGRGCDAYDGGRLAPYWDAGTAHFHAQIANAILAREAFARPG